MTRAIVTMATCAALLCAGTALATPTPQQSCDHARISAWRVYKRCVERVVARNAKRVGDYDSAASAKCRDTYFKNWTAFQGNSSLAGSTCIGSRFTDNGDQTVTDNLSGLRWEKKSNLDSTPNFSDPRDADNLYTWSTGSNNEDGTTYTSFLGALNGGGGFAEAIGWRLPTLAELQTIELDFTCTGAAGSSTCSCSAVPCIDGAFDAANTQPSFYWSAVSELPTPAAAWGVSFSDGVVHGNLKTNNGYVRAVRGGLWSIIGALDKEGAS